jgi:group II intron reverse transcriptase/maturase
MLLEEILSRENMKAALKQVESNKGCAGIDGIKFDELRAVLHDSWVFIRAEILEGSYIPNPVKRVEIPKPNGGTRNLGIPTVLDRLIQQAISQQLSKRYDKDFSENSYGYRPNRSAKMAVLQAQKYLNEGYACAIEIDLEKFFDTVNHDHLMHVLSERIEDKRVLKLIRAYLKSGVQLGDIVKPNEQGTPQGGPLSPLLSNILLDKLDKELEKRGHRFVRYADDICIYVRSRKAGERVLKSVSGFLAMKLKLKVHEGKSGVRKPYQTKLLGFSFFAYKGTYRIRVHKDSYEKVKREIRAITRKSRSMNLEGRIGLLNWQIGGWVSYFKIAECKQAMSELDSWARSKLRYCIWKTWKRVRTRIRELVKLGADKLTAIRHGMTRLGGWRVCHSPILTTTLTNMHLKKLGYQGFMARYLK